jgi:hypothetical protein
MDIDEAVAVLGVRAGMTIDEVRVRYRDLLRVTHPDVRGAAPDNDSAGRETARLNEAFTTIRLVLLETVVVPMPVPKPVEPPGHHSPGFPDATEQGAAVSIESGDTLMIEAPPDEAFALLLEASSRLGGIGYIDRSLGLLEVIVRFEGGPSCSVLMTIQGRAFGTDVFCTMDSIEADPTPAFEPVMAALLEELRELR